MKTRLKYLGVVAGSFLVNVVITGISCPFAGPSTPDVLFFMLGWVLAVHVIAAVLSLGLSKFSLRPVLVLVACCLVPSLFFAGAAVREEIYLRYEAVYDRFRDNLIDPIPESVADLEFVPLEESLDTHLMFRFSIDPDDLDEIIARRGFVQIDETGFRISDDLFTDPEYLPLAGPVSYYIVNDVEAGYADQGIGEGYTLKVSGDRRRVIFRRESAAYYLNR